MSAVSKLESNLWEIIHSYSMSASSKLESNLWTIIHSYLGTVEDIFNLAATSNHFYNTQLARNETVLQKYSIRSFRVLLQVFKLPLEDFVRTMETTGAVISGSFALQCVRGSTSMFDDESDIDIYVCAEKKDELALFLTCNGYICDESNEAIGHAEYALNPIFASDVGTVFHYSKGGRSVQIITMASSSEPKKASRNYDFTICQVSLRVLSSTHAAEKKMVVSEDTSIGDFVPHFSMKHPGDVYNKTLRINECYLDALKALWLRNKAGDKNPEFFDEVTLTTFENTSAVLFSIRYRAVKYMNRGFLMENAGGSLSLPKVWCKRHPPEKWGPSYDGLNIAHYLAISDTASNNKLLEMAAGSDSDRALLLQPCSNGYLPAHLLLPVMGYPETFGYTSRVTLLMTIGSEQFLKNQKSQIRSFGNRMQLLQKLITLLPEIITFDFPPLNRAKNDMKFISNIPDTSDISAACNIWYIACEITENLR
jgi:hypothetical protein